MSQEAELDPCLCFFEEGDLCKHLDSSSLMPYLCVIEFVVGDVGEVGNRE